MDQYTGILNPSELIDCLPSPRPFRFVDRVVLINDREAVSEYTFRADEYFYPAHFPEEPVTPGVILIEAMGQGSVVLQGLYSLSKTIGRADLSNYRFHMTRTEAEFFIVVSPGELITMRSTLLVWRRNFIRCRAEMLNSSQRIVAVATLSGMAVKRSKDLDNFVGVGKDTVSKN